MFSLSTHVRPDERHETFWATGTLFLVLVAHAILETARDSLFLAHLPVSHLPWVYLALATLALLASRFFARSSGRRNALRNLIVLQTVAAAGTLSFLFLARPSSAWALYALYLWGGLASTLIVIRFWLLLTSSFTVSQAKRLFPIIIAGPALGSLVGYGLAGVLSHSLPPSDLLGVSASMFLLSAGGSFVLWRSHPLARESAPAELDLTEAASTSQASQQEVKIRESVALAARHPYVRRVAMLLLLASVTTTLGDYVFKSVVARSLPADQLNMFLAKSYFVFELLSLGLLFTAVVPFVRRRGVIDALMLQPALVLGAGVLLTVSGGLGSVLCLRGIDGALRWSFHKTATEMLYVPMSPRLRRAVKTMSDIVAHRGGQALGSFLILVWLAFAGTERTMGPVVIACAAAWVYLAISLRAPYLDLFRETLSRGYIETRLEFPDLDMASLETLIAALSNDDDHKVLAAMDLLQETERAHLIPALILYHPSPEVVVHALELFTALGREDCLPITRRLLRHDAPTVRAAAMRACAVVHPDPQLLREASESKCSIVAASALVALAARDDNDAHAARTKLAHLIDADDPESIDVRRCVARAMRDHPAPILAPLLTRLAEAADMSTRLEAVRAMGMARNDEHIPVFINCLAPRELRAAAREALLACGEPALDYLERALADLTLPRNVRVHLPRAISSFGGQRAADMLFRHLLAEPSGLVHFKILRGLGRMLGTHPDLELDATLLDQIIEGQLTCILQQFHWRIVLEQGATERPQRRTIGHQLLTDLLHEKESLATERLFRILGLRYRAEDLAQIHEGLRSPNSGTRSTSRELMHGLLPTGIREALMGLTDELPESDRLAACRAYYKAEPLDYETLLLKLVEENSATLSSLAAYHAGELGIRVLRDRLEHRQPDRQTWLVNLRRRSLDMLDAHLTPESGGVAHET